MGYAAQAQLKSLGALVHGDCIDGRARAVGKLKVNHTEARRGRQLSELLSKLNAAASCWHSDELSLGRGVAVDDPPLKLHQAQWSHPQHWTAQGWPGLHSTWTIPSAVVGADKHTDKGMLCLLRPWRMSAIWPSV